MAWFALIVAGIFEIVWAFSMKLSDGFTRPLATVVTVAAMIVSFTLLSFSMRALPLGTAYTIWTGIGALGAFIVGILVLGEQAQPVRVLAAVLIVTGLVLMTLATPASGSP